MLYAGAAPPYEWAQIVSASELGICRLLVGVDAVKIGDADDSVRVNVCQLAAQELADRHDCALLTTKLVDLRWEAAGAKPTPTTIAPYPADHTWAMVEHSRRIDQKLPPGFPVNMLVGNVGKGAVNSALLWEPQPRPDKMAIYGWHSPAGKYDAVTRGLGRVIQSESIKHFAHFVDYSATVVMVRRELELTDDSGSRVLDIGDMATDPRLWPLVSASGPIIMRHPAIACPPLEGGNGPGPVACPLPPSAPPAPSSARRLPTGPLIFGGVALALGVAYFATR
jgi:hypothetical protein